MQTLPLSASIQPQKVIDRQNLSLQEHLFQIPGLHSQNTLNQAQDLRISIRGFGARSAFGIRGIKLIVDGIPESTPDGQGQLDNLDLNSIERLEVIRGLSSGMYGNASGGVIVIDTRPKFEHKYLEVQNSIGSFGTSQNHVQAGIRINRAKLTVNVRRFTSEGFRDHSASTLNAVGASLHLDLPHRWEIDFLTNYTDSPEAQDPGSLTLKDALQDRESARQRNIDFMAGEEIDHLKTAITVTKVGETSTLSSSFFIHHRNFLGRLPFAEGGIVNLQRNFYGNSSSYTYYYEGTDFQNKLLVGWDLHLQNDHRKRFFNELGTQGDLTLDQMERFTNVGLFLIDHFSLDKFNIHTELRYDYNAIDLQDQFLSDGDDSGEKRYQQLSYGFGVSYLHMEQLNSFVRISSNFETPTLSELSALPTGGGLNSDLAPITSQSLELGMRWSKGDRFNMQAAAYYIQTNNEILPFELADFPGRDFFRNLGETSRVGIEVEADYPYAASGQIQLSYNYARFRFEDFETQKQSLMGNRLPGLPTRSVFVGLRQQVFKTVTLSLDNFYNGHFFADNENETEVTDYLLVNLKMSWTLPIPDAELTIYGGINNLLDKQYFDNIRINAFGNRYYETAPGSNYFLGINLRLNT